MNAEIFSEWLRLQGYQVIRTSSSYWFNHGPRVYQAFPYHWLLEPEEKELEELLWKNKAIGLRYSTPLAASEGMLSYHVVCNSSSHEFAILPRKVRQDIRRGLAFAPVQTIPISGLSEEGWTLRSDTLLRQGRGGAENKKWWQRLCQSALDLPGFEAWGAIHEGQLVSSFLAFQCDDCYTLLLQQSATSFLRYGINNALFFTVTHEVLKRPGIAKVFIALHSLDAPASVDQFKFRMGYSATPVRQRVVFHPWIKPIFNSSSFKMVQQMLKWNPRNPQLTKVEGMLRFYLQGRLPLDQQPLPTYHIQPQH